MARTAQDLTPPELAVEVSGLLRAAGIEHAVGGALALGFYAEPHGTLAVDLNIFVDADNPGEALDVLAAGGIAARPRSCDRDHRLPGRSVPSTSRLSPGSLLQLDCVSTPAQSRRTREVSLLGSTRPNPRPRKPDRPEAPVQPPQGHRRHRENRSGDGTAPGLALHSPLADRVCRQTTMPRMATLSSTGGGRWRRPPSNVAALERGSTRAALRCARARLVRSLLPPESNAP